MKKPHRRYTLRVAVVVFACYSLAVNASQIEVKPGTYRITSMILLPNPGESIHSATATHDRCVNTTELSSIFPVLNHNSFTGCALERAVNIPGGIQYTLLCDNMSAATGTAEFKINTDSFTGNLDIKMGGKNMKFSQTVSGLRIGAYEYYNSCEEGL